ncbi:S1 RNA-binding domain-containing protein [Patescibacteria group bacterium]|nr:S1 RNA-binding domain-containing protein [Patescibacteria group bacterium]MBU2579565.1 S1 RNA-binding domain-containing protein [Patescibacteria group bacterium]
MKKESQIMKDLLEKEKKAVSLPQAGDIVEGRIIKISKSAIIVELGPVGTGVVYGGELKDNRVMLKELAVGQEISALVLDPENEDGFVELSLKEAHLEKIWKDLQAKRQSDDVITVKVMEANRGGLVVRFSDLVGFLPVSQLSHENYPRVENGDKNAILQQLNQFIGKDMTVKIINLDKKEEKMVVSEKAAQAGKTKEDLLKYKEGDIVEGTVATLANFGAFIRFDENIEGLAHISELEWRRIDHPSQVLKLNEKVKAKIISIQNGQVALSLKALKERPQEEVKEETKEETKEE